MSSAPHFDFDAVARAALAQAHDLLPRWFPAGKFFGREFVIGDLSGTPGESLSINAQTGAWADFSTDDRGGDLIALFAAMNRLKQLDAAKQLADILGGVAQPVARTAQITALRTREAPAWDGIFPIPDDAPPPPQRHPVYGVPVHVARYCDAEGRIIALVYRCEPSGERKQVLPLTYCRRADGHCEWRWQSLPKARSLYRAELLAQSSNASVLLVEGEPKCDAANAILPPAWIAMAWPNGAKSWKHADWRMLAERTVVIWPDADATGIDAATQIAAQLGHYRAQVRVLVPPAGVSEGWDVGDAIKDGWSRERLLEFLDQPKSISDDPASEWVQSDAEPATPLALDGITALGHDHGVFYYLSHSGRQVVGLTPQQHTRNFLGSVASVAHYWSRSQFVGAKGKIDWDAATDHLMATCHKIGIYDPERIRGRGAWFDDGRTVLHLGDRLIVDGAECPLALPDSRAVYEAALPMLRSLPAPLSTAEAHKLVTICGRLAWEKPINGVLLAGFLAIAPICGGLAWRPSIWLTGPTASGKSWVYENIVAACLRGVALFVQSKTSEAGIRQALSSDARPVAFDEAEAEDAAAQARIQAVLDLIRQSSSEAGGDIIKGTSGHIARRFRIRSCFAMMSINVSIHHAADESRITVLAIRPHNSDPAQFAALNAETQSTLTPEFAGALIARSAANLPIIRANADAFARAVAIKLGSRRAGDQLGALLAGAYSLHSEATISSSDAALYVEKQDWSDVTPDKTETDERRLLAHITQHRVRFTPGNSAPVECTVGRLIGAALGHDERIIADLAEPELRQIGIKTDPGGIFVSTSHPALRAILATTPWAAGWSRSLLRLPGAEPARKTLRFGFGFVSKATWVPIEAVDPAAGP